MFEFLFENLSLKMLLPCSLKTFTNDKLIQLDTGSTPVVSLSSQWHMNPGWNNVEALNHCLNIVLSIYDWCKGYSWTKSL